MEAASGNAADGSGAKPVVGITPDVVKIQRNDGRDEVRYQVSGAYARAVMAAGGVAVVLAPEVAQVAAHVSLCDAFVLTGGDDPRMEEFGEATHPKATPVHPQRQAYELALLRALDARPEVPVLGVCLGMQMMAVHHEGALEQYMPDGVATWAEHYDPGGGDTRHAVYGEPGIAWLPRSGIEVASRHRQCVMDAGRMRVAGRSGDGVVEGVELEGRRFYVGVQWHPERSGAGVVGDGLFEGLVSAAGGRSGASQGSVRAEAV